MAPCSFGGHWLFKTGSESALLAQILHDFFARLLLLLLPAAVKAAKINGLLRVDAIGSSFRTGAFNRSATPPSCARQFDL
jgi:hypothetical protein